MSAAIRSQIMFMYFLLVAISFFLMSFSDASTLSRPKTTERKHENNAVMTSSVLRPCANKLQMCFIYMMYRYLSKNIDNTNEVKQIYLGFRRAQLINMEHIWMNNLIMLSYPVYIEN